MNHRDDEKRYIESVIANNPDRVGWFYADDGDGTKIIDWYFITHDHSYFSNKIIKVDDNLCAFNEFGRSLDTLVSCSHYKDEKEKQQVWILNSFIDDLNQISLADYLNLEFDYYYYFNSQNGIAKNKIIDIVFSDGNHYKLITNSDGQIFSGLLFDNKLCVKGLIANEHMFVTPYKKFGTIIVDKVPFLISSEGEILNTQKFRYKDGKVYAYVNSDKTFFYSTNPNDKKWY